MRWGGGGAHGVPPPTTPPRERDSEAKVGLETDRMQLRFIVAVSFRLIFVWVFHVVFYPEQIPVN